MASSECFWMDSSSLAGWPSLRTFVLHCVNLSTKLSTATLEGAQQSTCTDVKIFPQQDCRTLFAINLTHLLALLDGLEDDFHHGGGLPSPWWSMDYGQLSLGQSKAHSFSLRIIEILVEVFNFV